MDNTELERTQELERRIRRDGAARLLSLWRNSGPYWIDAFRRKSKEEMFIKAAQNEGFELEDIYSFLELQ